MISYSTLIEALNDLARRGYKNSYILKEGGLFCPKCNETFAPDQVKLVETHRFEADSDEEDIAILYVLQTGDTKGVVVDAYGTYANSDLGSFLNSIK